MKQARLLISLLLLATLSVDLAVLVLVSVDESDWPELLVAVLFALAFSQVSLASIWVALGRLSAPWRLTGAFLVVAAWSVALSYNLLAYWDTIEWMAMLLIQALVILGPMLVLRASGVSCVRATEESPATEGQDDHGKRQFSLRYLFAWITATAIVLGIAQYSTRQETLPPWNYNLWGEAGVFAAVHIVITCSSLWIAFGTRWLILRVILLAMIVLATAIGPHLLNYIADDRSIAISLMFGMELLLMLVSFWVIRVAGYRVKRSSGAR